MLRVLLLKPKARLKTIAKLNPIMFLEPLELGYLAAGVSREHEVRILDLRLSRRPQSTLKKTLKDFQPDVVGISGYTHEVDVVLDMAGMIRQQCPQAKVVVGGPHASVLPETFNDTRVDAIIRGEGALPFGKLVDRLAAGEEGFDEIENVLVPGEKFAPETLEKMPLYPDLDELPFPRRDLWDANLYQCIWPTEDHKDWETIFPKVGMMRTSFGCCMECSFCVVPMLCGRKHMKRTPELVADEVASIEADHIYFCDDETFLDPKHAAAVASAIEARGIKKRYFAWARTTTVNRHPELFDQWRRIGLDCVFLGLEAVSDDELKAIHKHSTIADNERAHHVLREMGIAVQGGFMVNASFTKADFQRLRDYIKQMEPAQLTFTVYTPSPGSPAWYEERKHYICKPFPLHDCMHPLTPTTLPLKEFFREFASLSTMVGSKHPLRAPGVRFPFRDIFRIIRATAVYSRALRNAWKDYKKFG
ncbi:MAG: B12-binding domain-containing radical SAM protein [Candidatus Sumerlaeia bacterium]